MEQTQPAVNHTMNTGGLCRECAIFAQAVAIVLEGIADGITALNPAGELIYGNDAAARLIGYPTVEALLAVGGRHHAQV
jgi:PAS domain-containing protein